MVVVGRSMAGCVCQAKGGKGGGGGRGKQQSGRTWKEGSVAGLHARPSIPFIRRFLPCSTVEGHEISTATEGLRTRWVRLYVTGEPGGRRR